MRLLEVRGRYYELLTHCIPPDIIFKVTKRERERERYNNVRGNERLNFKRNFLSLEESESDRRLNMYMYIKINCNIFFTIFLLQRILNELVANCDGTLKAEVTQLAGQYQAQSQLGSKAIFHLEAFTAKFMRIYKQFLEEGLESMGF